MDCVTNHTVSRDAQDDTTRRSPFRGACERMGRWILPPPSVPQPLGMEPVKKRGPFA